MIPLMHVSAAGRLELMIREGVRLRAYQDEKGIWTIGVGHSAQAGTPPRVAGGMTISHAMADSILSGDLLPREKFMCGLLKRQPSQNQFDAMQSLMFNIGDREFEQSQVLEHFNAGALTAAAAAFLHFCTPADLEARRRHEMRQFSTA